MALGVSHRNGEFVRQRAKWSGMRNMLRRNRWLVLLGCALVLGGLLRAQALYRWDGVAMQHPDERFLVYTAFYISVPEDFAAYLTTACPQLPHTQAVESTAKHFLAQRQTPLPCNTLNPRTQDWSRVFVYGNLPTTLMRLVSTAVYGSDARPLDIRNVGRTLSLSADVLSILMVYILASGMTTRTAAATAALLYALLPLPIQLSHFATVDALAGPFVLGALALLVRWERLRWPGWLGLAVCVGLASAIRITFVSLWVILPLIWLVQRHRPVRAQWIWSIGAVVVSLLVLWLGDPTIWNGRWFDARWLHDVLLAGRLVSGMVDTPPTFQWSWQTPYLYPLTQIALWGIGPGLFLGALSGWFWQTNRPRPRIWPVWLWVTLYLLWQGAVFGMTMRYYLPIYGAVCVLAVQVVPRLPQRWRSWYLGLMVTTTAVMALGWSGLYATEHPRITASRWIYAQVPAGATIAVEVWDDVLPLTLSATDRPSRYTMLPMAVFAPDRPSKFRAGSDQAPGVIDQLDQADYVVLSSARAYGVLSTMPARFPVMQRYYAALFDGRLGFRLVHQSARWPHIGPWRWDTRSAEEALSVYDHPQVFIFAKTAQYQHARAVALLTEPAIWSSVAAVDTRTYRAWPHLGVVNSADWDDWRTPQPRYAWAGAWAPVLWLLSAGALGLLALVVVGWRQRWNALRRWVGLRAVGLALVQCVSVYLLVYGHESEPVLQQLSVALRSGALLPLDPWLAGHLRAAAVPGWQVAAWWGRLVGADAAQSAAAVSALAIVTLVTTIGLVWPRWGRWPQPWALVGLLLTVPTLVTAAGLWHAGYMTWQVTAALVGIFGIAVWVRREALRALVARHRWGMIPLAVLGIAWARLQAWQLPLQPTAEWLLVGWPLLVLGVRAARQTWRQLPAQRVQMSTVGTALVSLQVGTVVLHLPVWVWLIPTLVVTLWCVHLGLPRRWVAAPLIGLLWASAPLHVQLWLFPGLLLAGICWGVLQLPVWRGWVPLAVGLALVVQGWGSWQQDAPPLTAPERVAIRTLEADRRGVVVLAGADGASTARVALHSGALLYHGNDPGWPIPAPYDWALLRVARAGQIARIRSGALSPCAVAGLDYWFAADGSLTSCPATLPLYSLPAPLVIPAVK